jgi:uncharacterized membrane protein
VRYLATITLAVLIVGALVWELWLAPLRPGGSWLALKAMPLLLPLRGVIRGDIYTYRWATMLVLAYLAEGVVRAYTERAPAAAFAIAEVALSILFFTLAIIYVRPVRSGATH